MIRLELEMLTSPGGRPENEDRCNFLALPQASCFVVCDGLGGHGGGEIAAEIAVDTVLQSFTAQPRCSIEFLEQSLDAANTAILDRQSSEPALAQMRSTVVALVSDHESALWAHVGDSRLYHFRGGAIQAQTRDHSVSQALADAGEITSEEIRFHEDRSRLRRCLGGQGQNRPTVLEQAVTLEAGDALLLCTDGFWEYVGEGVMLDALFDAKNPVQWLGTMESYLKEKAAEGNDNYTAVAVMVRPAVIS